MSSASNGLVVLAVARVASVDVFGVATLLFAFTAAVMGVGRGAVGTPIMLAAGRGDSDLRREAGFAATAALSFALAASGAVAAAAFLLGVPKMGAAFAFAIPLIVVVDVFRYTLISASRPQVAMVWDAAWAAGSALLFVMTIIMPHVLDEVAIIILWSAFAAISAVGMAASFRLRPIFRGIGKWWREAYEARIRYGLEAALGQVNVIIIASIATAVIGASAAASLRGAATLMAPLAVLLSALPLVTIPEAVRSGTSSTAVWRRLCRIALAASLLVVVIGPSLALLPEWMGALILGESWNYVRDVLPIISLEYAIMVWSSIAMSLLRFQGKSGTLLATTTSYVVFSIALCSTMAFLTHSAVGVAWGLAISAVQLAAVTLFCARPGHS